MTRFEKAQAKRERRAARGRGFSNYGETNTTKEASGMRAVKTYGERTIRAFAKRVGITIGGIK